MNSILTSIKKLLGISEEDESFDVDLIIHINSILFYLTQIGVGPETGFSITGSDECWSDFIGDKKLDLVKSYVYLKVKILFDPPQNSFTVEALKENAKEMEWRMYIDRDNKLNEGSVD